MKAAPQTENEEQRIVAIRQLGLLSGQSRLFDEVAAKVAAAFGTGNRPGDGYRWATNTGPERLVFQKSSMRAG